MPIKELGVPWLSNSWGMTSLTHTHYYHSICTHHPVPPTMVSKGLWGQVFPAQKLMGYWIWCGSQKKSRIQGLVQVFPDSWWCNTVFFQDSEGFFSIIKYIPTVGCTNSGLNQILYNFGLFQTCPKKDAYGNRRQRWFKPFLGIDTYTSSTNRKPNIKYKMPQPTFSKVAFISTWRGRRKPNAQWSQSDGS